MSANNKYIDELNSIVNNKIPSDNNYSLNKNSYISSKGVKTGLKAIFNSRESANFYIALGNSFMNQIDADEFSIESFLNNSLYQKSMIETIDKIKATENYKNLSSKEKNSLEELYYKSSENYNEMYGMEAGLMSPKLGEIDKKIMKGANVVFTTISSIIKKLILAISSFFKGIFQKLRGFFRKFTHKAMLKYFEEAEKVAKANPSLKVTVAGLISKNFSKFLKGVPQAAAKLNQKYDSAVKKVKEYTAKSSHNIFAKLNMAAQMTIFKTIANGAAQDLHSVGINVGKDGGAGLEIAGAANQIIFGVSKPLSRTVSAKEYLSACKAAGIDKENVDALLNQISKAMTDLQSKVTETDTVVKQASNNLGTSEPRITSFINNAFRETLNISKLAIKFYNISGSTLYKAYSNAVSTVVRIAKNKKGGEIKDKGKISTTKKVATVKGVKPKTEKKKATTKKDTTKKTTKK